MYAICLSNDAIEELQYVGVLEHGTRAYKDTIWFLSEDEDVTQKVMEYFEAMDFKSEIIQSIVIGLECRVKPLFKIISVDESFLKFNNYSLVKNIVFIEGLANEFQHENCKKIKEYHNKKFNYYFLTKIRQHLGEDIV